MAAGMATTWLLPTEQPSPVSSPSFNPSIVEEQQQQQQQQLQLQQPHDLPAPVFDYVARLTAKHKTSLSFTQGFLVGQLTVILLVFAFVKFFILAESNESLSSSPMLKGKQPRKKRSSVLRSTPAAMTSTILSKTDYDVTHHNPETLDWFNVLLAQAIAQFRDDARLNDAISDSLDKVLNGPNKPSFLGDVRITEINLGEEFPMFSNCRICPFQQQPDTNRLQAEIDINLTDQITLGVDTKMYLNYPQTKFATLPIGLVVTVHQFQATLSCSFIPRSASTTNSSSTALTFSLLPGYRLNLGVRSLVGSRSRLQDIPKIAQIVEARVKTWFVERCVEPRYQTVNLPSFWPSRANAKTSDDLDSDGSE